MTKELGETAYRTYCRDRLVVSESVEKVNADRLEEKPEIKKARKPTTLIIK